MEIKEFDESIKDLNISYYKLFGYIPVCSNYSCNREKFIEKMTEALNRKIELKELIVKNDWQEER